MKLLSKESGYYWIDEFIEKLEYYENNRNRYKNMEEFMPEIIGMYANLASKAIKQV